MSNPHVGLHWRRLASSVHLQVYATFPIHWLDISTSEMTASTKVVAKTKELPAVFTWVGHSISHHFSIPADKPQLLKAVAWIRGIVPLALTKQKKWWVTCVMQGADPGWTEVDTRPSESTQGLADRPFERSGRFRLNDCQFEASGGFTWHSDAFTHALKSSVYFDRTRLISPGMTTTFISVSCHTNSLLLLVAVENKWPLAGSY